MPSVSQYVTDDHAVQINSALASIQTLRSELDLATRAGIDPSIAASLRQQLDQRESQLRQYKQTYFPGQ